jgi:succinoglycan biosynthesis transport protein ExoP
MEIFDSRQNSEDTHWRDGYALRSGAESDMINLRDVLEKFWARKRLIFLCIISCAGFAFLLTRFMTPTYTGVAQLAIKPQQSGLLVGDQSIPVATQVASETVETEAVSLQSRGLASATIGHLRLDRDPEFNPSLSEPSLLATAVAPVLALLDQIQGWVSPVVHTTPEVTSNELDTSLDTDKSAEVDHLDTPVVNAFMSRLAVTVRQKSNVIQVSFKSSRALTAAVVPNTIIKLYLDQQSDEKDRALVQEREQLEKTILPAFREKVDAAERELAEYRQKSGLITDRNATVLSQELSQNRAELAMAQTRTAEAALRLREAQATSASPRPADPLTIERLREQVVALQGQLAASKDLHGPNYPQTVQLQAEIKQVENGIRRESSDTVGRLRTGLDAAQQTEAALSKRVTELTRQFALANGGDTQLQNLIGEAEADRKAYERYLARSNDLRGSIGHAQPDASFLSPAGLPLKSSPSTKLVVLGGIGIGMGAGLIWVTLLDVLLKGLRNEVHIEETLGIKCLGLVPKVQKSPRHGFRNRERLSAIRDFTLSAEYAAYGEAIRSAQMKLLRFDRQTDTRVILITAALPNEGKSWVAASLALSLAADGRSVALVDCDVNRPTVHRMFDAPRGPGLTDYITGGAALDEIIHRDPNVGASYIPIGSAVPREAWRKTFSLVRPLVDQLRERYEFVILDSAPVLAISDTILLSQIAQKTILVVKWASTPPAVARRAAVQLLESAGAEVAALLSMVNTKRAARDGDPIAGVYKALDSYYGR